MYMPLKTQITPALFTAYGHNKPGQFSSGITGSPWLELRGFKVVFGHSFIFVVYLITPSFLLHMQYKQQRKF